MSKLDLSIIALLTPGSNQGKTMNGRKQDGTYLNLNICGKSSWVKYDMITKSFYLTNFLSQIHEFDLKMQSIKTL